MIHGLGSVARKPSPANTDGTLLLHAPQWSAACARRFGPPSNGACNSGTPGPGALAARQPSHELRELFITWLEPWNLPFSLLTYVYFGRN
jgi:hypothetical protein